MDCLISEGVFSKNVFYRDEGKYGECIYLTYERFENMLQAGYLLYELKFDFKALEEYEEYGYTNSYQPVGIKLVDKAEARRILSNAEN